MWVDIFKKSHYIPPPIDISPREPVLYELRVVVWNTEKVLPKDWSRATNEEMSDIYVKGQVECVPQTRISRLYISKCSLKKPEIKGVSAIELQGSTVVL